MQTPALSKDAWFRNPAEKLWLAAGATSSLLWFLYNLLLPPLYKGRVCCDSVGYIGIAEAMGYGHVFNSDPDNLANLRTVGYPFYLYIHKLLMGAVGWQEGWVPFAAITCWVLLVSSLLHFYHTLKLRDMHPHPLFLFLALAYPALASSAALPLADALITAVVTFGISQLLRKNLYGNSFAAYRCAATAGLSFGYCILSRPSYWPSVLVFFVIWTLISIARLIRNDRSELLQGLTAGLMAILVCSPGLIHCNQLFHRLCMSNPNFTGSAANESLKVGLIGARVYTSFADPAAPKWQPVPDPWLQSEYASCMSAGGSVKEIFTRCWTENPGSVPIWFFKKWIGLFDNLHVNTYAVDITHWPSILFNRSFNTLGFFGFFLCMTLIPIAFFRRRLEAFDCLAFFFPVLYLGIQALPHVEARYGLPAVPGSLMIFALVMGKDSHFSFFTRKQLLFGFLVLACVYWGQALSWDQVDPVKY